MEQITLRAYNQFIERLIAEEEYSEAIAHCRHILQHFPKHVETYRQLGQAYLEAGQESDAADVFSRVLTAIPDDFIAHVGMSIVYEHQDNLRDALWHMERAFEAQPYNPSVQDEMRRLYEKVNGAVPPRLRLTRGALARIYLRNGLTDQAIAELRSALADEPNRADLMVLLAQAYAHQQEWIAMAQVCTELLNKLPFCYQANLLMLKMLLANNRPEEAEQYRKRLIALDPYFAFTSPERSADQVPDDAVTLERLEWTPEMEEVFARPAQPITEEEPVWPTEEETPSAEAESAEEEISDLIPDWMREQGWVPREGPLEEEPQPFEEPEEEEIARAELPDWLKEIAPEEVVGEKEEEGAVEEDEELARLLGGAEAVEEEAEEATEQPSEEEALPEWLAGMEEEVEEEAAEEAIPSEDEALAWLESLAAKHGAAEEELLTAPEERAEQPPEWLAEQPAEAKAEAPAPEAEAPAEEIPEWLKEAAEETLEEAHPPEAEEAIAAGEWLPEEAVAEEPAVPQQPEEIPEWLKGEVEEEASAEVEEAPITEAEVEAPEEAAPAETPPAEPVAEAAPPKGTGWLEAITEAEKPEAEEEVEEWLTEHVVQQEQRLQPPPGTQDRDLLLLEEARSALDTDDIPTAVKKYTKLIRRGKLLDIVISDLEMALVRHPVDVDLFMTLGDAYLKENRLPEALEAYSKAEALLR